MADVFTLVDAASDATVYFGFANAAGTGNPNSVKTRVLSYDLGSDRPEPSIFVPETLGDASLIRATLPPVPMVIVIRAEATTWDNLEQGLEALRGYLLDPTNKRVLIQLDTEAAKRYADPIIGDLPSILRGQGITEEMVAKRDKIAVEVPVTILRKPGLRKPEQTFGPTTVPNDPADANGRVITITVPGSAPVPATVMVKAGTAGMSGLVIARKAQGGYPSSRLTDYASFTKAIQLNASNTPAGTNWTIALSGDTSSQPDTDASGGNTARIAYTSDPTVSKLRIRATRTANLDSLRGDWDVYLRCKASAAARHILEGAYGPSLANPAPQRLGEAEPIDTTGLTTFDYTDHYLGRISTPQNHPLVGFAFEIWARRESGTGNLDCDFLSFVPAGGKDSKSRVVVPGSAGQIWNATQLATPVNEPAGGTAGTLNPDGTLDLDNSGDNAGTTPNVAGLSFPAGRHTTFFWVQPNLGSGTLTYTVRIRNITSDNYAATKTIVATGPHFSIQRLDWDSVAGQFYQPQIVHGGFTGNLTTLRVFYIEDKFVPWLAAGEEIHSDAENHTLHKMDASDSILFMLDLDYGLLPLWLLPGVNAIYAHYENVPVTSGAPGPKSLLTQDCPITIMLEARDLV